MMIKVHIHAPSTGEDDTVGVPLICQVMDKCCLDIKVNKKIVAAGTIIHPMMAA